MAGEIFKKRREELGVDIKEVSDILKISTEYLSAIEDDIFDKLPVAVYTIGYIRCYAKYLDIAAEPVIINFVSHLTSPKPSTIIPVFSSRRKVPVYVYAMFVLLAGFLALALFIYSGKNSTSDRIAEEIQPAVKGNQVIPAAPVATNSEFVKTPADSKPEADTLDESVPAVVDKNEHQLGMTAFDTVWIQIRYENGKIEEMLLRSGTSKTWSFADPVVLRIGNAGGVTLKFDGKDLGVPGKPGQVLDLTFPQS